MDDISTDSLIRLIKNDDLQYPESASLGGRGIDLEEIRSLLLSEVKFLENYDAEKYKTKNPTKKEYRFKKKSKKKTHRKK